MAGQPFKGVINVDIRDSVPDWAPFEPPKAPDGAPNVVYIVLDDVGFSAMSCYGGPIETPNIDRIADEGVRYTQWHTTALCSPTRSCLLTGRNHTRNSMACITEAAIGFPNASGTIPPENGMLSEILGELGWNTYMVGKWHLCPTDEMNLAAPRRNWPTGRGFERWYGFLGAETNQWYPDLVYDNHPVDQPKSPGGGLPLHRGHHRQGARVHPGRQGDRARQAVLPLLRARRRSRAAPRAEGVDREVQGPVRHGLRGDARGDARPSEGDGPRPARHRAAAGQPDRHARDADRAQGSAVPGDGRDQALGHPLGRREEALLAHGRGLRRLPLPRRPPHRPAARLPRVRRRAREHRGRPGLRQRRQRRGRTERLGQREPVLQRHAGRPRLGPRDARRARRPQDLQPLRRTAGRWPSTRRSRCGSATSSTAARATRASSRGRPASRPRASSGSSTTTRSTSCRRSSTASASRPRDDQGARAERLRRRQHALQLRRRRGRRRAQDPVLLDARLARHLARGLEGRHHPSHDRRLERLQRRHLGALPHRRGPLRAARPGDGEPGEAAGARRTCGSRRRAATAPSRSTTARRSRSS